MELKNQNNEKIVFETPPIIPEAKKPGFLSRHMILGYVFLITAAAAAIAVIYYWQLASDLPSFISTPKHRTKAEVCIQVITPAKNSMTGETKDFPTPCDVPEGWEIIISDGL